jgi:hypothetical protein
MFKFQVLTAISFIPRWDLRLTKRKQGKLPELARYRYKIQLEVEETKLQAERKGFKCRLLEGQPKNRKCKDGYGEPYPLPQYEITGGTLSENLKIEIAPSTTQIYFFGNEFVPPKVINEVNMEPLLCQMELFCRELEHAEEVLNEIAVFSRNNEFFNKENRIYSKTPAMYRLIISSRDIIDQLFDNINKLFMDEVDLVLADLLQGRIYQARKRLDNALVELEFFGKSLLSTAREMNDPRTAKLEADLEKALNYPTGLKKRQDLHSA